MLSRYRRELVPAKCCHVTGKHCFQQNVVLIWKAVVLKALTCFLSFYTNSCMKVLTIFAQTTPVLERYNYTMQFLNVDCHK
jgi:hypothetical protein